MRGKIKYFCLSLALIFASFPQIKTVTAASCPQLRIVFARGSGGEKDTNADFLEYKSTIQSKLRTTKLNYEFIDLNYPAVGVGLDNIDVTLGAYIGAGETHKFGDSVNAGVTNLVSLVNHECPNTKYVIGGYSQGAIVISKALAKLNANKIIYAATFGDPKIYLPEGKGINPAACRGQNLSRYRMYVPDCQAYKGLLGAFIPYEPAGLAGKVGTWCNKSDIFCSSRFGIKDHVSYVSDQLYEDASRVIFDKIAKSFNIENRITSPHDTVILIDSTGSMRDLINSYKDEALRLSQQTLATGGRVALYDYRDLDDPYEPREHCDFNTCTLDKIKSSLNNIEVDGGGDEPESLLSAAFRTMKKLKWKYGATKSLVVLTDSNFLSPDRDGISIDQVVKLSKEIDPVNFYIITNEHSANDYQELATSTDGLVVTDLGKLNLLTDYIMERYDSLPRVEEIFTGERPTLEILNTELLSGTETKVTFKHTGEKALVILNDQILGLTTEKEITISGLRAGDKLALAPIRGNLRGDSTEITLSTPKAPNTGAK